MKVTVLKNNIREGMGKMEHAVAKKDNLPILRNVFFKSESGKITITATNLEMGVMTSIAGKISEDGGITVPFQTLFDIVSNADSEKISLETSGTTLRVKTDNYEAKIQGVPGEDFPIIPAVQNTTPIELDGAVLNEALMAALPAAHLSEIRPELSGVLLDFQITFLKFVATDSFRLAEKTVTEREFKTTVSRGFRAIVPLEAAREAARLAPQKERVQIFFDPHQVAFRFGGTTLPSRLIDGTYPDYESIVPKTLDVELDVNRDQLMKGIRLASSFSGKSSDIKLRLKSGTKALEVYSSHASLGENTYLVPAKCLKGESFTDLSFNWRYVLDGLKSLRGEHVLIGMNGDTRPSILRSTDDTSYFYIVMPIRL